MLFVSLIWLYVLPISWIAGFSVLTVLGKSLGKGGGKLTRLPFHVRTDGCIMAGLIVLTVYAQIYSLFGKVGLAANVFLLIACAVLTFILRREMWSSIKEIWSGMSILKSVVYLFLFLLFAYGTSGGIIHYDTSLYHAQSIRWLEEYGVVKGLGNLHCRLAYNSAAFGLSALFSFSFLGIQSFHTMAGLFALLLAKVCGELAEIRRRKKIILSDLARIMGIYYILIIFDEMVSPASDYFMVFTVFYLVIRWMDLLEKEEKEWILYGLLCLVGVYTMSLKLSAALILLLVVKPAVMLVKEKEVRAILVLIGWGTIIILPYLIRNYLISGWLIYPFTFIDLFSVDWKIPAHVAIYDAKEIQVWGRGIYDVAGYNVGIGEWFGGWFREKAAVDKLFIVGGILALPAAVAGGTLLLIQKRKNDYDWLLLVLTVDASFLLWLLSAPLIRYGCVYVWLAPVVTFGAALVWITKKKICRHVFLTLLVLAGIYKGVAFAGELVGAGGARDLVSQQEYENFEVESYEISGMNFYHPKEGDRTGYDAFPSSPEQAPIRLRGKGMEDGFYTVVR